MAGAMIALGWMSSPGTFAIGISDGNMRWPIRPALPVSAGSDELRTVVVGFWYSRTPMFGGHVEMSDARSVAIDSGTNIPLRPRVWRGTAWLLAVVLLPVLGGERLRAEESAESALPQLPAKIRAQLEADQLRREIALEKLRRELEALQGSEGADVGRRIERLGALRRLLEVDSEVRELLADSPEMAAEYDRIVNASEPVAVAPRSACACLESARVHWLGEGDQAGQVIVYLDGLYYDVEAGEEIGDSRCSVQQAMVDGVTLECGGETSARSLHNPVGGDLARMR